MTRSEKVAWAQELRAQGLLVREISERMDAPRGTVSGWVNDPDLVKLRARKASYRTPCPDCGRLDSGSEGRSPGTRCRDCGSLAGGLYRGQVQAAKAEPRYRLIERRWQEGRTLREIAAELHSTKDSINVTVNHLRSRPGYSLPYRHSRERRERFAAARWPS